MSETNYRLKYRKGDFEVEVQGDKGWVEKKFKELTEQKVSIPEVTTPEGKALPMSLVEYVRAKGNPDGHSDLSMIFAYWLHHKRKMSSYNSIDIGNCYSEARITPPKNIPDTMNKNQGKGYLMTASEKKDGRKAWVITHPTGEEYVEQMK